MARNPSAPRSSGTERAPAASSGEPEPHPTATPRRNDAFERFIERSSLAFSVIRGGTFLYANAATIRLLGGGEAADLLGRRFDDLLPGNEDTDTGRWSAADPRVALVRERLRRLDGRLLEVEIAAAPIVWRGEPAVQLVVLDRTERARDAQDERRLAAQLQQAQKLESIGRLARGIAHDFNDLLTAILSHSGLALDALPADAPTREHLEQIESLARRAASLTTQVQAFAGAAPISLRPVSLSRLVADLEPMLRASIPRRIELRHQLAEDLPAIAADPGQIEHLLMNLTQNAAEAIGEQHGVIGISTGTMRADAPYLAKTLGHEGLAAGVYVYLVVSDTGCGMTNDVRERAFEPYFAAREGRSGLGLAAVMGVVRRHGGAIKLDSREDEGTTVRVLWPLAKTAEEAAPVSRAMNMQRVPGTGMTILVADDEPSVRSAVRKILEQAGHRVLEAEDGRAAVEMFRKHSGEIAVMIVDYDMPGLSGEDVVRTIRRSPEAPRILVSSGHAPDTVLHRFPPGSIDGFLPKPWGPIGLISKLDELLHRADD